MSILIISNNRAEAGPLASVIAALPEAAVIGLAPMQQTGPPAQVMSFGLWWFNREFEERKPAVVVVLGDRYETLSAALAALYLRIPVVHIHGGETTRGAWDDSLRDMVTRASVLHCVATAAARERVLALLGTRDPRGVEVVGAPGLDGVPPQSASRSEKRILVTYHPETLAGDYGITACQVMLDGLETLVRDYDVIFTGVNNDPGATEIRALQRAWAERHEGAVVWEHITHAQYAAYMQSAALVVGNSSAGVIESAWIGVPSVNIGSRQDGRPMAPSVFSYHAISSRPFVSTLHDALGWRGPWEPCYKGGAALRIAALVRGMA